MRDLFAVANLVNTCPLQDLLQHCALQYDRRNVFTCTAVNRINNDIDSQEFVVYKV